jgi:protein TonB
MIESTARAERFEPQSPAPLFYTWAVPQKPVSVRIPFALIDRLEREAVESFRSLRSRGSEIGGLLLGYVSQGDPAAVSIEDYELVACDYSRGPLYRLSDADMGNLKRAMEQRRAAGGPVVAGFFRSHTRKGLALDADDLALFKARFGDPRNVALLIRPFATKASTAGIFIWEDGAVQGDASYLEFPFRSSELAPSRPVEEARQAASKEAEPESPAPVIPKPPARGQIVPIASRREIPLPPPPPPVQAPAPESVPEDIPRAADPAPAPEIALPSFLEVEEKPPVAGKNAPADNSPAGRFGGKLTRMSAATAALLLALVLLFVYPGFLHRGSRLPVSPRRDSSSLALRVERTAGELLLTWNRESDAIKSATRAVLSISDGEQRENVEMDLAQLRNGSIEYFPSGSDVVFRMEVTGPDHTKTMSESVRVLRTRPSPMQPQDPGGASAQGPAKPTGAAAGLTGAPPAGGVSAPASASGEEATAPAETRSNATPLKPFNTESLSQRLRPVRSTDLPDAPEVGRGGEAVSAAVPVGVTTMPPPLLTSAPPAPAAAPQSAAAPVTNTVASGKKGGDVQQAQLVSRKDPEYPPIAKQSGAQGEVLLTAVIGVDGKVKDVKVVQGHPLLRNAAVAAVKQWIYKPTLLNGNPVEAETKITLNFVARR